MPSHNIEWRIILKLGKNLEKNTIPPEGGLILGKINVPAGPQKAFPGIWQQL